MVGTNLKAETMNLMDKRSDLEAEMNVIIERLCQPGGPGLSGNLVDSEGFPRSDIDIPVVRADRLRLADYTSVKRLLVSEVTLTKFAGSVKVGADQLSVIISLK